MKRSRTEVKHFRIIVAAFLSVIAACTLLSCCSPGNYFVDDTLYAEVIQQAAERHQVPPELLRALIYEESRFRRNARGKKGEIGLTQIMRSGAGADWAEYYRKSLPGDLQLFEPELNIEIGSWYLGRALRRWSNYKEGTLLALAEYNAGLARTKRWKPKTLDGKVLDGIDYPATRRYVDNIWKRTLEYRKK